MPRKSSFVLWLSEVDETDIDLVGGKGAKSGEMVRAGFPVRRGFIVSSRAYFSFIRENQLAQRISDLISTAHFERADSLAQISAHIKRLILHGRMQEELVAEIYFAYRKLGGIFRDSVVEVYSSPTGNIYNGIPASRQAGLLLRQTQDRNDTECKGEANLILKIKEGWSSLFEPRAILFRHEKKLSHFRIGMAVVVQKRLKPECSGLMYTIDKAGNDKTKIVIEAMLPSRRTYISDHYELRKADLEIINKINDRKQKLTKKQIIDLAMLGKRLEKHYYFPQEIKWAIEKKKIYILGTRSISNGIAAVASGDLAMTGKLAPSERLQLLLKGVGASAGIATGRVRIVASGWQVDKVDPGDIIVVAQTNSSFDRAIKKAGAIVADQGGRISHCAVLSRELGIPAVVGAGDAVKILKDGSIVTVNGFTGEVNKGCAEYSAKQNCLRTATKVYVNLSQSGLAAKVAAKNVDGVGISGAEFLKADIGIHPDKLFSEGKGHIYSEKLAEQVRLFCKEFTARPVIYRVSDFHAGEYRELEGGKDFEAIELNPALGYRGSFRHIHESEIFRLELEAVKKVRQEMGYKNLWVMLPFCRTVKELIEIKKIMTIGGIHRSPSFRLWMTVEVPSNVILIDKFIEAGIDGVSIGLDNLTMLMLGMDPQNNEVAKEFDERNPAVLWALERVVKTCHKYRIVSSLYGKSALMHSGLLEKLIEWGISSVSVAHDAIESTRERIFKTERRLIEKRHYGKN